MRAAVDRTREKDCDPSESHGGKVTVALEDGKEVEVSLLELRTESTLSFERERE
jgi:hypothetical protein